MPCGRVAPRGQIQRCRLDLPERASHGCDMTMPPEDSEVSRPDPSHSRQSSLRARILEHIFIGELGQALWCAGIRDFEILRSEVDASGHDLVIECNGIMRHVQLKSSFAHSSTRSVDISLKLAKKPSGCVIWLEFDEQTLKLGPYRWFGAAPHQPLPSLGDKISRHTRGHTKGPNPQRLRRPEHRVVGKAQFRTFDRIEPLVEAMFGRCV
jgi:hypothetical protein